MATPKAAKFGHVFLILPKDMDDKRLDELKNDCKSIQDTFKYLGFKESKENRDEVIEKKEDLEKHLQQSVDPKASVIFVHIIARVVKKEGKTYLLDKDSRTLLLEDVMKIFAERENKDTKIVIFLQELNSTKEKTNMHENNEETSIGCPSPKKRTFRTSNTNAMGDRSTKGPRTKQSTEDLTETETKKEDFEFILMPQNMLLATLPEKENESSNLVEILCEELRKAKDIDSALTSMIGRASNIDFYPMFSSTMNETLSMEDWGEKREINPLVPKEVCLCLRAWLISTYYDHENLGQLFMRNDLVDIANGFQSYSNMEELNSIKIGRVENEQIKKDLEELKTVEKCELQVLIISSHYSDGGIIHTSNGQLTWEEFFESMKHLEDIPKLIIGDLCRGPLRGTSEIIEGQEHKTRGPAMLPQKLPKNTMMILSCTEGAVSNQIGKSSNLIHTFCSKLENDYFNRKPEEPGKNLFTLIHETMMEVRKKNDTMVEFIEKMEEAKEKMEEAKKKMEEAKEKMVEVQEKMVEVKKLMEEDKEKMEDIEKIAKVEIHQVSFASTMMDVYRFKYNAEKYKVNKVNL